MNCTTGAEGNVPVKPEKMEFTPVSIAVICLGFTITPTFQLWLNCNQELEKLYGLANPSQIQTFYAIGTMCAILVTAVLVKKFIKPVRILIIYFTITVVMLIAANLFILNIAGILTKIGGTNGPKYVLLLNIGVTLVGILIALYVNVQLKNKHWHRQHCIICNIEL